MEEKTINVFLASSTELSDDREFFSSFVRRINKTFRQFGIILELQMWEDFDAAYKGHPEQKEYDNCITCSDMFLALFYTIGGEHTIHEFDVAVEEFNRNKKSPKVYVYMKKLLEGLKLDSQLEGFQQRLKIMGLYWTTYNSQDYLRLHFIQQLLILCANGLVHLKLEDGTVKLGDMPVAEMSNLSFAADNKDYNQLKEELEKLPNEIEKARKRTEKYPDDEDLRDELQEKLNRYNNLKEEFAQLQQTLFDTSQRIATMQRENLSDKLRRATEAFESGNMERANTLLDEIAHEAETHHANLEKDRALLEQDRELVHQDIEAFLLQAKTKMTEVNTPIEERIKEVHAIYAKADQWAKDSALPDEKLDGLLKDYAQFLYDYGKYKEAEQVYLRLVSLREKVLGKNHSDTAESYNDIGTTYDKLGHYTKALDYHFKALDIYEKVLGLEHPDTATSYNNIGLVYNSQGDYPKALEYYFKALDIVKKVLGEEHPNTASSYNNIGGVYYDQGDYPKALEYHFKALEIYEKVLGKEHPSTATTYNNIGLIYDNLGDYPKALEYFFKALDIKEKVLGKEHPNTATTYNNIGLVYKSQGDYTKAIEYFFKALDIYEKVLGKEHPLTATSYNNIGVTYINLRDYTKAIEYLQKALYIYNRKLGPNHPYTKETKESLNICQSKINDTGWSLKRILRRLFK